MIPYFEVPKIPLGFTEIEVFGVMTAGGIITAALLIARVARKEGKDPRPMQDFVLWAVGGGIIMGHLVHLFLYHPEQLAENGPIQILKVWEGLSSMGGLLGGIAGALFYFRRHNVNPAHYSDAIALGMAPGWGIARIGCFLVHDHPGVPTDFFLAVNFPPGVYGGVPRHDLGLYDAILLFTLTAILWTLHSRGLLRGRLVALLAVGYGSVRFFFDFLRARDVNQAQVDARYFGLTPAQYIVLALVIWGVWALSRKRPVPQLPPRAKARSSR